MPTVKQITGKQGLTALGSCADVTFLKDKQLLSTTEDLTGASFLLYPRSLRLRQFTSSFVPQAEENLQNPLEHDNGIIPGSVGFCAEIWPLSKSLLEVAPA